MGRRSPRRRRFDNRFALNDHLHATCVGETPLEFLEFGVWRGDSTCYWARLDRNLASRFFGFDTFTGLRRRSIVIFDEFSSAAHEFRAFIDYSTSYRRSYELLAYAGEYEQVALRAL